MLKSRASALVVLAFAIGACTGAGAGATPSATSPTSPAASTAATAPATATATPAPSVAVTACPFGAIGYPGGAAALNAPSDRLVNVLAKAGPSVDTLTFVFELKGPASPSGTAPVVRIKEVKPPFSYSGSGKSFDVKGDRHLQLVFDGMTIADADGSAVFTGGPLDLGKFTGLRDAVQYDNFEGVQGWIVGMSDTVCASAAPGAPNEVVLTVAHN